MIDRRDFALTLGASLLLPATSRARTAPLDPASRLRAIEHASGGRLGAFVLDTGSGRSFGWRADERFCHCSTFKLSLAALALHESDAGHLDLTETLPFSKADIVGYSPVVEKIFPQDAYPFWSLQGQCRSQATMRLRMCSCAILAGQKP